jgi:hypothetical protein
LQFQQSAKADVFGKTCREVAEFLLTPTAIVAVISSRNPFAESVFESFFFDYRAVCMFCKNSWPDTRRGSLIGELERAEEDLAAVFVRKISMILTGVSRHGAAVASRVEPVPTRCFTPPAGSAV